jgi:broad specificity phosphatase PhoE
VIFLVRHALAVRRGSWDGTDRARPLTARGERQAASIVTAIDDRPVERILTSPAKRCVHTIEPLAGARGLSVKTSKLLGEGRGDDTLDIVLDAIEDLLDGLRNVAWPLPERPGLAKGSTWILSPKECTYLPPPA